MDRETSLGQSIRVLDDRAKLDAACKRLLSEKVLLAWIMKDCLEEYKNCSVEEIAEKYIEGTPAVDEWALQPDETSPTRIQSIGQEDTSLQEHTILYDIRFHATAEQGPERLSAAQTGDLLLQPADLVPIRHGIYQLAVWEDQKGLQYLAVRGSAKRPPQHNYPLPYDRGKHGGSGERADRTL